MFSKKLSVLTLLFVGVSLGAVEIEYIDVAQQWSLDCGAHAFKNAILGIELLQSEDDPAKESEVQSRIGSYPEYKKMTAFMDKKVALNPLELGKYIESQGVQNVYWFDDRRDIDAGSLTFWAYGSDGLKELLRPSYIKSFIIPSGARHTIACTIQKVDGVVTRVISMDSLRWNLFKMFGQAYKFLGGNVTSEREAVQRVVDLANDQELAEQVQLYDRYQRCLKMAQCMANSFYVTRFAYDYISTEYEEGQQLSQDLVDDFGRRFKDFVQTISMDESGDNRISDKDHARRLTRVPFLETFLPDSSWWTDASLFSDEHTPPDFTEEERAEMIELMHLDELLAEVRGEFGPAEEPEVTEELFDSGSEERSIEESKGEGE